MGEKRKSSATIDADKNSNILPTISYWTLYRFATKWDRFLIAVAVVLSIVGGVMMPFTITLLARIYSAMIENAKLQAAGKKNDQFLATMGGLSLTYAATGILNLITSFIATSAINVAAINQVYNLRQAYLKAALNQDFSYFDLRQTGDFASRMADDVIKLEEGIGDKITALIYNMSVSVGCMVMAFIRGWKLALLCLVGIPVTFLLVGFAGFIADHLYKKEANATSRASAIAEEVLGSIRTVYAFSGQKKEIERYTKPMVEARKINMKKDFFVGLSMGVLFFCIFCVYALSLYFGIYLIINEPQNYNADIMFAVFQGVMTGSATLGILGSLMESFGAARGAGAQIFHLIDHKPTINPLSDKGLKPDRVEGNIEFKNVKFHYPSRPEVTILKDLSFNVSGGQSVALVGHSGSGKSTVVQLISRNYDVVEGSILLDGRNIQSLSVRWLRSRIGIVSQEPVLFSATVRENIRYGFEAATNVEIETAARQANAHNFIAKLPKGYETLVGERGASLSGGQKQRVAIARALVRDPRLLLLDEATSALDTASEAKVQAALDKASKGRTTIVVAHRLTTVRNADMIHVLKDGEIIESGNHAELMSKQGYYYNMVKLQAPPDSLETAQDAIATPQKESSEIIMKCPSNSETKKPDLQDYERVKEPKPKLVSTWRVIAMNAPEWKSLTLGSIASFVNGFGMPLFALAFGTLFSSMYSNDAVVLMKAVKEAVVLFVSIGVLMAVANFVQVYMYGIAGACLTERLRCQMFAHLLKQDIGYFDDRANSTGALCARLSSEASYVRGATGQRIGTLLQGVGAFALALLIAIIYEFRIGLVYLSFLPVVIAVFYFQGKYADEESFGTAKTLENSTKVAVEAVSNMRTVASLGREPKILQEYAAQLHPALALAKRSAYWRGVVTGMSRSVNVFIMSATFYFGATLIVNEKLPYGNILIVAQALQMASVQSMNAFLFVPEVQKGIGAASRILDLLNKNPVIVDPEKPAANNFKSQGDISFKEVYYRYPTRPSVTVLKGLTLDIERGQTLALLGASGCGKSTVIQLLQRYYDPVEGTVALDKIPLPRLMLSEVRGSMGLVSQEPVLFDRSIGENIAYGDNSRVPDQEEIVEAAKQANIHSFIVSLPMGYDTNIGSRGTQLSGGQKQRVAIARALLRQPKILLLDEATSALDSESEKIVQEALDKAKKSRTCILIAHRLSSVRDADVICVLHDGNIAEKGTHAQLVSAKGLYSALHRASI